jgi:hypothetical protein
MTSPASSQGSLWRDVSFFEKTHVLADVTADDAPNFFQHHGVFYQAIPGVGEAKKRLGNAAQSVQGLDMFEINDVVKLNEQFFWTVA